MAKILVVEDEKQIRRVIELHLTKAGHEIRKCANGQEGIEQITAEHFDLVITDLQMPKINGLEFLEKLRALGVSVPSIVMTAFGSVETAVEAMKLGAADYLSKPLQLTELSLRVDSILSRNQIEEENKQLKKELAGKFRMGGIVGKSPVVRKLVERLKPLANDGDISVLLIGESGTGKELAAKAIHYNSPRSEKRFIAVNCGALPENLLESELFGYEKGAFTDAKKTKIGIFEAANGGSLFLDEIGSMPLNMQVKLLRALEEREIRRVGGTKGIGVDVRFIAASNQDLESLVKEGRFRQDLFYRLAVATVNLPPLRKREGDIRLLTLHFLEKFNSEKKRAVKIKAEVFSLLENHRWTGNIRELENLVELLVVTAADNEISISTLPESFLHGNKLTWESLDEIEVTGQLRAAMENFERKFISTCLGDNEGNVSKTAKEIGISRSSLHSKIKELKISRQ